MRPGEPHAPGRSRLTLATSPGDTPAMFSRRLPARAELNPLTRTLQHLRASGAAITDLTESNPTRVGLSYPPDLLNALSQPRALRYDPEPLGLPDARRAVALDHLRRGVEVDPEQVVLAASTSEAYTWLFKLLCDPGDAVLVPRPSYPLFEHLTRLEGVRAVPYDLTYHGRWEIDVAVVRAGPPDVKAVIVVSPNNPTGSFVSARDLAEVSAVCGARGWSLVADEVFADYPLECDDPLRDVAAHSDVLAWTLGGLSKSIGLPQVKLGWMVVGGPVAARREALARLELIADSFLSVSTPVQVAAADLLARGAGVRAQIHERVSANLRALRAIAGAFTACEVLRVEGGWSAVLRVPATRSEEQLVLDLLERAHVLVHPGFFFDFQHEAFIVLSLLAEPQRFAAAAERVLRMAQS
jgi:alanine-synthesizing transaminase